MTDQKENKPATSAGNTLNDPAMKVAYLESLKQEAELIGMPVPGNISAETLAAKISEFKKEKAEKAAAEKAKGPSPQEAAANVVKDLTSVMRNSDADLKDRSRAAKLLHRVIVTCHDPSKTSLPGQIFTVGNSAFGTEKKYVKFGEPWHVSTMMLNAIKEKNFLQHYSDKDKRTGRAITRSRLVPAYSVQTLPALTTAELEDLARKQSLRATEEAAN